MFFKYFVVGVSETRHAAKTGAHNSNKKETLYAGTVHSFLYICLLSLLSIFVVCFFTVPLI